MGDGSLSQDEIDALLQGADDITSGPDPLGGMDMSFSGGGSSLFTPAEQGSLRHLVNSAIALVAPSLSGYLGGKNLVLSNPVVEVKPQEVMKNDFRGKYVQVSMDYTGSINGKNLVIFNYNDAGSISSLMMGDESGLFLPKYQMHIRAQSRSLQISLFLQWRLNSVIKQVELLIQRPLLCQLPITEQHFSSLMVSW